MNNQWNAIKGHNTLDRLKEIKVPTLILGGKQDVLLPSRNSKILARNISNSELKILQGGHGFWIESEKEFTKVVLDFLSKYKIQEW